MLKILAKMPLQWLYRLASVLHWLAFYVVRHRRSLIEGHIRQAFPEWDESRVLATSKAFIKNIMDVAVEIIASNRLTADQISQRMVFDTEKLKELQDSGQSFVLLSAHMNNWEWLLLSASVNFSIPVNVVYKPLRSKTADQFMYDIRSRFGVEPITMKSFANEVIRRKGQQQVYCILADQKPKMDAKVHTTQFLNRATRFFVGPEKIAQFAKIPVYFVKPVRVSRGHYRVELKLLAEPPYQKLRGQFPMTEAYVREVENMIHEQPESWLWGHKRWKGEPPVATAFDN